MKEIGDRVVDGKKSLRLSRGFEALHNSFSSPRRLMRILVLIVQALVMLAMLDFFSRLSFLAALWEASLGR